MKQAMRVLGGVACMLATLTQAAGPLKLDTPMDAPLARAMLAQVGRDDGLGEEIEGEVAL